MAQSGQPAATTAPILVVDDDVAILETVIGLLELEGYPVAAAANGAEALRAVERERPALVILDMRMPVLDGWGFARAMRERGLVIPILVMTAAQDARQWAGEVGAAACIPKPFDIDDLLGAIAALLAPKFPADPVSGELRPSGVAQFNCGRHPVETHVPQAHAVHLA